MQPATYAHFTLAKACHGGWHAVPSSLMQNKRAAESVRSFRARGAEQVGLFGHLLFLSGRFRFENPKVLLRPHGLWVSVFVGEIRDTVCVRWRRFEPYADSCRQMAPVKAHQEQMWPQRASDDDARRPDSNPVGRLAARSRSARWDPAHGSKDGNPVKTCPLRTQDWKRMGVVGGGGYWHFILTSCWGDDFEWMDS